MHLQSSSHIMYALFSHKGTMHLVEEELSIGELVDFVSMNKYVLWWDMTCNYITQKHYDHSLFATKVDWSWHGAQND